MTEGIHPANVAANARSGPGSWGSVKRIVGDYRTEAAIAGAIIVIELIAGAIVPAALTMGNIVNIVQAAAPLVIMTFGELLVIITAGIDLSVGAVFSLTGMITGLALVNHLGIPLAVAAGLGVGVGFGAMNGLLVTLGGLAPFVVTLISYAVAGSLAFIVTNGDSLPISTAGFGWINSGTIIPGVANYFLYCVVLVVVIEVFLKKMVAGRWVYAAGSASQAARLLGVPVRRVKFMAYVVSGLLASSSAIVSLSYISSAEATAGSALMLQSIAAVVIGGASLFGGTGTAVGALLGALMITVIQNGVNLIGINSFWQGSVTGAVILVAVLVDRVGKSRR